MPSANVLGEPALRICRAGPELVTGSRSMFGSAHNQSTAAPGQGRSASGSALRCSLRTCIMRRISCRFSRRASVSRSSWPTWSSVNATRWNVFMYAANPEPEVTFAGSLVLKVLRPTKATTEWTAPGGSCSTRWPTARIRWKALVCRGMGRLRGRADTRGSFFSGSSPGSPGSPGPGTRTRG